MSRPATGVVVSLVTLLAGLYGASVYLVRPWAVGGRSMQPALAAGDRVLVDRWSYRHRPPRPGEVVVVLDARGVPIVKRVARLEVDPSDGPWLWVEGDNRAASDDSRRFGPVAPARLRGRVAFRYWPPSRAGPVR